MMMMIVMMMMMLVCVCVRVCVCVSVCVRVRVCVFFVVPVGMAGFFIRLCNPEARCAYEEAAKHDQTWRLRQR